MIRPIVRRPAGLRHRELHEALSILHETHKPQPVEIPEDITSQYMQKYAHMLAGRWAMKVSTRVLRGRGGPAYMFITERACLKGQR